MMEQSPSIRTRAMAEAIPPQAPTPVEPPVAAATPVAAAESVAQRPVAEAAAQPPVAEAAPAAKRAPKAAAPDDATADPGKKEAKKAKPPALEDKPLNDFIQQDYLPALQKGLAEQGVATADLTYTKSKIPVSGFSQYPECWQVEGKWQAGQQQRQFNIYFFDESLQGQRGFSYTESQDTSTLESFRIDEKKLTLDLLVQGTLQRLNGQKWLALN
jgi:hypothetical protein